MGRDVRRTVVRTLPALVAGATLLTSPAIAGARSAHAHAAGPSASSLYHGPGPRPGPDVLYEPVATAPQLTNTGIWSAPSILISGASAYRRGEFLYQDYLYDDNGAREIEEPDDPRAKGNVFSKPNGNYIYPSDPRYANNAADLVELRVKPLPDATAFRVTLNTMIDPSLVAVAFAIGGNPDVTLPFPYGANVRAPADMFLTVHPSGSDMVADLVDAATQARVAGPAPVVHVDMARRQIEVRVSHQSWYPGSSVVRLATGVGLWDKANGRYLLPQPHFDSLHPGGAGADLQPAAFFNVAFRYDEPEPTRDVAATVQSPAWWRDADQGEALANHDISKKLFALVDFGKLLAGIDDDMTDQAGGVPSHGPIDRILQSHYEPTQGVDFSLRCELSPHFDCPAQYQGRLQPYAIDVPSTTPPSTGYGLTLLLHSAFTNYNSFQGSRNQSEFADRGPGSIVLTPEGRGPFGDYFGLMGADLFEAWADVAAHYPLNPDWTDISGYSEGGIGTFLVAEQFPDLFARAHEVVGTESSAFVPSMRNIPVLMWHAVADEATNALVYGSTAASLDNLGYRYELDVFAPAEHTTLAINDEYGPAAAFLGTATVNRNPHHVTYVVEPPRDAPAYNVVADHAYWLSGIKVRDSQPRTFDPDTETFASPATVDAVSYSFGIGDATPTPTQFGLDVLTGGNLPVPLAYTRTWKDWGPEPSTPVADRLDLNLQNVSTITVDVARAHLSCNVDLQIASDGPATITLAGCNRTLTVPGTPSTFPFATPDHLVETGVAGTIAP